MDAIQFLKQEHKKAKAGLRKVLKASPDTRGDLWNELQPELEAHEQIEDACLYGPLARGAGKADAKLAAWRAKHQKEVERVEGLVGQIGKGERGAGGQGERGERDGGASEAGHRLIPPLRA